MANAAARVFIDDIDKLLDGVFAISNHMAGHALGSGNQFAVDDQQAVIEALQKAFDDNTAAVFARFFECFLDLAARFEIYRNSASVISGSAKTW